MTTNSARGSNDRSSSSGTSPVLAETMVRVFSFRFLERITGAGIHALRALGRRAETGPSSTEPGGALYRAATEKLATATLAEAVLEPADAGEPQPAATAAIGVALGVPDASASTGAIATKLLSRDEEAAFQAIAAMLGARKDERSDPRETAQSEKAGDSGTSEELDPPKLASENAAILDLLPLGILVLGDPEPIFVNRFLLDFLGAADLQDAVAGGRLDGIARHLSEGRKDAAPIEIEGHGGANVTIFGLRAIAWDGAAAWLACLGPGADKSWKRTAKALNDARRQAEQANALKSDFLAKVSHEIRTPLNAILGFAEVILDERFGPIGNARYKEYLEDIRASGAHVMSLVNDLLDLSKIEAGKMDLAFVPVDANAIVAECASLMEPQASRERVVLRLALRPDLPLILADERSVRQIVLNLLSNAVKFNAPGGQVLVATALATTGQALLQVKDNGIGMSDPEIAIALEPFGRVAGTKASVGTGLGLPLTKALVEANGARFSISSKKSEGTLVEIAFKPA